MKLQNEHLSLLRQFLCGHLALYDNCFSKGKLGGSHELKITFTPHVIYC